MESVLMEMDETGVIIQRNKPERKNNTSINIIYEILERWVMMVQVRHKRE